MDDDEGLPTIGQLEESAYGRGVEQLLLSSYFGLESTKPQSFSRASEVLFKDAAQGNAHAALAFLEQLSQPPAAVREMTERFASAKRSAGPTIKK